MPRCILSVAEKPSVAKELAKIISGGNENNNICQNGRSQYNKVWNIPNCTFKNERNYSMNITSVTGHLTNCDFEDGYKNWTAVNPVDLFHAKIITKTDKKNENIEKELIEQARKCEILLLWLDCDLEGENICFEVINIVKKANPRIDIYRARFSALIPRDIIRTLNNPERPNKHMSDAVETRKEIDLRLGAAFTRFQTLRLQNVFPQQKFTVISYGPCQFPTLGFVVERYLKITSFVPQKYWYLLCSYEYLDPDSQTNSSVNFSWDRNHIFDRYITTILYESCIEGSTNNEVRAIVTKCDAKPTSKARPTPLNTIELTKRASRFLKMGSERTMAVAEALYMRGIISYPRTETDFFKEGTDLRQLLDDHRNNSTWGEFVCSLLDNNQFLWPRTGTNDDQAHPPIHPTKSVELTDLTDREEKSLYELISRHFFACCAQDAQGEQTNLNIEVGAGKESFHATGLMITRRNYLDMYSKYEGWSAKKVPVFRVGDTFTLKTFLMRESSTEPPSLISESDLIGEMDRNQIGTDATIATHITTIQQRNYAIKDGQNRFTPTPLGIALVEAYNSMGYQLNRPYLRASMEADMAKIARGQLGKDEVIKRCLAQMKECFLKINSEANKLDEAVAKYVLNGTNPQAVNPAVVPGRQTTNIIDKIADATTLKHDCSTCGICLESMKLMNLVDEREYEHRFLYCSSCSLTYSLPKSGDIARTAVICPICKFGVVSLRNIESNKEYKLCPKCYNSPPDYPIGPNQLVDDIEGIRGGKSHFTCYKCCHTTCTEAGSIAGGDIDIAPCSDSACTGAVRLGKSKNGKYIISCRNYTTCGSKAWWVPTFIKSITPKENVNCNKCTTAQRTVKQMEVTFTSMEICCQFFDSPTAVLCLYCHPYWSCNGIETLKLKTPVVNENVNPRSEFGMNDRANTTTAFGVSRPAVNPPLALPNQKEYSDYGAALSGANQHLVKNKRNVTDNNPGVAPACNCPDGATAEKKVVTKDTGNKGREFYCCKRGMPPTGCKFFAWV